MSYISSYFRQFAVLRETNREFWAIQAINFLDSTYAFAFVLVSTLFLTNNMGMNDVWAGAALTWLGIATSIFFFAAGPIVDRYGVKKALYFSLAIVTVVRLGMAACGFFKGIPHRDWIFLGLMCLGGLPGAIKSTAYQIGVKRYTTARSQSAGFNLWYVIMNVGALAGTSVVVQLIEWAQPNREHKEYVWVIVFGLLTSFLCFLSAWLFIKTDAQLGGEAGETASPSPASTARKRIGETWARGVKYTLEVIREPAFARMMAAMTLTIGVRMVFLYWSILSPKYWKRTIGPEAAIGLLNGINPFIIIIGLLLLVPIINRYKTFNMLTYGCFTASISLLPMVTPWYWWASNTTHAYYIMSIVSMVSFSIGEIMFSPRLSQYILAIAPQGQEGIYSSFAAMPYFVAKTCVGFLSGVMLMRWCPETRIFNGVSLPLREVLATRQLPYWQTPEAMWLILALAAVAGPIVMVSLKSWFLRGMHNDPTHTASAH
jgi:proton-dependent oligopeptide transporter, POT family